eukprot:3709395-Pleurochrysis_carterae.AAC.6
MAQDESRLALTVSFSSHNLSVRQGGIVISRVGHRFQTQHLLLMVDSPAVERNDYLFQGLQRIIPVALEDFEWPAAIRSAAAD